MLGCGCNCTCHKFWVCAWPPVMDQLTRELVFAFSAWWVGALTEFSSVHSCNEKSGLLFMSSKPSQGARSCTAGTSLGHSQSHDEGNTQSHLPLCRRLWNVFRVEGLGQDWLEKEKLSCASRYFEVTCLSVGVFGIICFEGCFHSCLWLSWLNNESYLLPVDGITKVKVHNWLCALILSVHLLSYTEVIWMNQCLILTFWKLNDWSTFIPSFRHS